MAYSVGPAIPDGTKRLHLNEYRYEHPPRVVAAARRAVEDGQLSELLTNYRSGPDPALVEAVARYAGAGLAPALTTENVVVTAGSDDALRAIVDTSPLRGHRAVLLGEPTYTHFRLFAELRGLEVVSYAIGLQTPMVDHLAALRYHAPLMRAGCLVYMCSPNNPTGDVWGPAVVAALALEFPASLFLVDEAYTEFAAADSWEEPLEEDPDSPRPVPDAARILNRQSVVCVARAAANVVAVRTMSKAFGLAALRVGYAVGTPATLRGVAAALSPNGHNPLAARVACAALAEASHYLLRARAARTIARGVIASLRQRGWWVQDTPANFYLVYVGDPTAPALARLAAAGIQARDRGDLPGLAGFVRLTAGSAADGIAVTETLGALTPPSRQPPQLGYTSKGVVAAVKTLMRRTLEALAAAGITVWAQSGTMLGMFRHGERRDGSHRGGMIPWDDDGDLAYLREADGSDPLATPAAAAVFAAAGLTLQRNRTKAYWQCGVNPAGTVISPVHIDIFSYHHDAKGGYTLDDERFAAEEPNSPQAHCNTRYSHDELFPLRHDYTFYDIPIAMPAQSERVLRRSLGDDFMTTAKMRTPGGELVVFTLKDLSTA